jgi:hypothetical protein
VLGFCFAEYFHPASMLSNFLFRIILDMPAQLQEIRVLD